MTEFLVPLYPPHNGQGFLKLGVSITQEAVVHEAMNDGGLPEAPFNSVMQSLALGIVEFVENEVFPNALQGFIQQRELSLNVMKYAGGGCAADVVNCVNNLRAHVNEGEDGGRQADCLGHNGC